MVLRGFLAQCFTALHPHCADAVLLRWIHERRRDKNTDASRRQLTSVRLEEGVDEAELDWAVAAPGHPGHMGSTNSATNAAELADPARGSSLPGIHPLDALPLPAAPAPFRHDAPLLTRIGRACRNCSSLSGGPLLGVVSWKTWGSKKTIKGRGVERKVGPTDSNQSDVGTHLVIAINR